MLALRVSHRDTLEILRVLGTEADSRRVLGKLVVFLHDGEGVVNGLGLGGGQVQLLLGLRVAVRVVDLDRGGRG